MPSDCRPFKVLLSIENPKKSSLYRVLKKVLSADDLCLKNTGLLCLKDYSRLWCLWNSDLPSLEDNSLYKSTFNGLFSAEYI